MDTINFFNKHLKGLENKKRKNKPADLYKDLALKPNSPYIEERPEYKKRPKSDPATPPVDI